MLNPTQNMTNALSFGLLNPFMLASPQRKPADKRTLFDKRRAYDNRSHCCARGIVTDDQLKNFVDSQLNFYWMARTKLKSMKDQHCKDISELLGSKEWSKPDNDQVRFRSHRGLTGLYSAVKGWLWPPGRRISNIIFSEIKKKTEGYESKEEDQETDDERLRTMVKSEMKYHPAWSLIMKEKGARKRQVQVFKRFTVRLFCFFVTS